MVHRRVLLDDARGVGEPLNETMCGCTACDCPGLVARGVHRILLSAPDHAARLRRTAMQVLDQPPLLFFAAPLPGPGSKPNTHSSAPGDVSTNHTQWSMTEHGRSLPDNVHVLTLAAQDDGSLLVRLAHLYEAGEGGKLGQAVEVSLSSLLHHYAIDEVWS